MRPTIVIALLTLMTLSCAHGCASDSPQPPIVPPSPTATGAGVPLLRLEPLPLDFIQYLGTRPFRPYPSAEERGSVESPLSRTAQGTFRLTPLAMMDTEAAEFAEQAALVTPSVPFQSYWDRPITSVITQDPKDFGVPLPPEGPLRPQTPIRNQGSRRLTCVAHAALAAMENQAGVPPDLSEQYAHHLFMLRENHDCCHDPGMDTFRAAKDLQSNGVPIESQAIYVTQRPNCRGVTQCDGDAHPDALFPVTGPLYQIHSFTPIGDTGTHASIKNPAYLESIIATGHDIVLSTGFAWDSENGDGIIDVTNDPATNKPWERWGGHDMLLVGFNREKKYFIAKNSWGTHWGSHQGYLYISYAYVILYANGGFFVDGVDTEPIVTPPPPTTPTAVKDDADPIGGALPPLRSTSNRIADFCAAPGSVAISITGRVFVAFPRIHDNPDHALVEVRNGAHYPYPNRSIQRPRLGDHEIDSLISVRGLAFDRDGLLWVLDSGIAEDHPVAFSGPKLIAVNVSADRVAREILVPPAVILPGSILDGLAVLSDEGREFAFVSDAQGGVIVIDLRTGKSRRALDGVVSLAGFAKRESGGIAISHDRKSIYYRPDPNGRVYIVALDALVNGRDEFAASNSHDAPNSRTIAEDALKEVRYEIGSHDRFVWRVGVRAEPELLLDSRGLVPQGLAVSNDGDLWITFDGKQPTLRRLTLLPE